MYSQLASGAWWLDASQLDLTVEVCLTYVKGNDYQGSYLSKKDLTAECLYSMSEEKPGMRLRELIIDQSDRSTSDLGRHKRKLLYHWKCPKALHLRLKVWFMVLHWTDYVWLSQGGTVLCNVSCSLTCICIVSTWNHKSHFSGHGRTATSSTL